MANAFYEPWVRDGRPYRAARPIAEVVAKLKAARPKAADLNLFGSIGDLAHLTATVPKDHTPYSQTGWPDPSPYGIGFATDIMHRPDLGLDCHVIFKHWITEARAGRLPWLKYLIWNRKSYSVRSGWVAKDAIGHEDHIHASARTGHVSASIGDFDPLGDDMADTEGAVADHYRGLALLTLNPAFARDDHVVPQGRLATVPLIDLLRRVDIATGRIDGLTKTVQLLAEAVNAGGGSIETAAVLARIDERAAEDAERDAATAARIAELEADLQAYRDAEAAGLRAQADELHQRTES